MVRLSVFDENFSVVEDIEDESIAQIAAELSMYFKGVKITLSDIAKEVVEIESSNFRSYFIKLMLFANGDYIYIKDALGVTDDVIDAYKAIIWNTDKLKGQIGRVELFMEYIGSNEVGSKEYEFGVMLKEAYEGGQFIVMDRFHIEVSNYSADAYKDRIISSLVLGHKKMERGEKSHEEYIKEAAAADKFITVFDKSRKSAAQSKSGTLDTLLSAIEEVKKIGYGEVEVPILDTATGDIIDVETYDKIHGNDYEEEESKKGDE